MGSVDQAGIELLCGGLGLGVTVGPTGYLQHGPGAQFNSQDFTGRLLAQQIQISMDGRGRALDNIFVERLWRTVKYEDIYLKEYHRVVARLNGVLHFL